MEVTQLEKSSGGESLEWNLDSFVGYFTKCKVFKNFADDVILTGTELEANKILQDFRIDLVRFKGKL